MVMKDRISEKWFFNRATNEKNLIIICFSGRKWYTKNDKKKINA